MWRTTVVYNMEAVHRDVAVFNGDIIGQINELQALDNGGNTVEGFEQPSLDPVPLENFTVKRDWNSEQHARTLADLVTSTFGEYATVTVEQQV